jgi:hypothetical protein
LGALAVCSLCMVGGGLVTYLGSQALVSAARLSMSGAVTQATVSGSRITQSARTGTSYEVRYFFVVPGEPTPYTAEDETGRTNLWESLADEPTWRAAVESHQLEVEYLPSDPHVNRPLRGTGASFGGDQAAGLGLGLCLLVPSTLVLFGVLWGQIRRLGGS